MVRLLLALDHLIKSDNINQILQCYRNYFDLDSHQRHKFWSCSWYFFINCISHYSVVGPRCLKIIVHALVVYFESKKYCKTDTPLKYHRVYTETKLCIICKAALDILPLWSNFDTNWNWMWSHEDAVAVASHTQKPLYTMRCTSAAFNSSIGSWWKNSDWVWVSVTLQDTAFFISGSDWCLILTYQLTYLCTFLSMPSKANLKWGVQISLWLKAMLLQMRQK